MKTKMLQRVLMLSFVTLFVASCGSRVEGDRVQSGEAGDAAAGEGLVYNVDVQQSVIEWTGSKPTGTHNGTIAVQQGSITMGNESIVAGEFVIDMNSIVNLDLTDPKMNGDLVGHLKSADFFEVETYPTAKFVVTGSEFLGNNNYRITGNLTMKDTERSISFNAQVDNNEMTLNATSVPFVIDRAEWNVKYGSRKFFDNLKDNFINDEIGLTIKLVASR